MSIEKDNIPNFISISKVNNSFGISFIVGSLEANFDIYTLKGKKVMIDGEEYEVKALGCYMNVNGNIMRRIGQPFEILVK